MRESRATIPLEGDLLHSPAGERYSKLVDGLLGLFPRGQVLVTSHGEGEGKTTTAVNLALAFHTRRIPVLLCELSLKRAAFRKLFGASPLRFGVESVLDGKQKLDAILCKQNDNGLLMAMVNEPLSDDRLLVPGDGLHSLLSRAREAYDWSIFDGASVFDTPQMAQVDHGFDVVLLVVRRRITSKASVKEAIKRLDHPRVVVVFNDEIT